MGRALQHQLVYNTSFCRNIFRWVEVWHPLEGNGLSSLGAIGRNLPYAVEWDAKARSQRR
ncbi:hypothetical protein QT971_00110 [Microcoleus sp. herbarium19]|uniref:hypothetical protein n=1 Tax=unclassified Microcoleus TaxID=2642155 RepID=UPI002FD4D92B